MKTAEERACARWLSLVETAGHASELAKDDALLSWDLAQINPGCTPRRRMPAE
jgi:hypothetical protein